MNPMFLFLTDLSFLARDQLIFFLILLPLVAMLYSSVGHGGASGYLALMALFGFPALMMKPTALLLNVFVAGISAFYFYRNGHLRIKLFVAFALTSIPASFIGGYINVDPGLYKKILGVLLVFAVVKMLMKPRSSIRNSSEHHLVLALLIGAVIGFFSGLIGIGGGIILSPILLLLGWANVKETAAVSALFIWVNSLAGMTGLYLSGMEWHLNYFVLALIAFGGGLIGARIGSSPKIAHSKLKILLAAVLTLASIKLLTL